MMAPFRVSRDSHLDKVPGFVEFHLLKGPEAEDHHFILLTRSGESRALPNHVQSTEVA
jgi:heme-degrading monooxygenase HmoA